MVTLLLALVIGALWTAGVYLLLQRQLLRIVLGLILLGHAANLLIFVVGSLPSLVSGHAPLIREGVPVAASADPLPQALVLTAIVINLGITALAVVVFARLHQARRAAPEGRRES